MQKLFLTRADCSEVMENIKSKVPRFECPEPHIEEIFRFRWMAYSTHLFKRANGKFIVTEFSTPVSHSGVDGTVSCPAWHHISEGRWIGDRTYMKDYLSFWLTSEAAPRLYSFPLADSAYRYGLVSGDDDFIAGLFDGLAENYFAWERERFDKKYGLFWQIPDRDGMEFALLALAYGRGHGGEGYRSTINSYMYADAVALARMAEKYGHTREAALFAEKAQTLKKNFQFFLWHKKRSFFVDRRRDNRFFLNGLELEGYFPWFCNMPDEKYSCAWKYITDPEYFCGKYGLRTLEKNHEEYLVEHSIPGMCMWNGWCWPFASSLALTGMANLLNDYQQNVVTAEDYYKLLETYTLCHYKDGVPHLAENYEPDEGYWYTDRGERSKYYNHSSYCDLVISGLAGFRPAEDGSVVINPLIPADWDYFALSDITFVNRKLSVIFDRNGKKYNYGKGLLVLEDGKVVASSPSGEKLVLPARG